MGRRSSAEVESAGEVISEGARYLRLAGLLGDAVSVCWASFRLLSARSRDKGGRDVGDVPGGCFECGSVLVFGFLTMS
jgi:hypothetical protein